jgi:AcrR family transcriptional regulator
MKTKDTREKILQAGLSLFSEKGYLGATTKEIAKRAGVAELTLFRHFASKDKLFEEIINSYSFLPALKGLLPEIKDLEYSEALKLIAEKFLERLSERRQLIRIMHSEIQLYPSEVKNIYHTFIDEIFRSLASYFNELQKKGVLRKFKPEIGARAFLGMFFSYFNAQEFMSQKKHSTPDKKVIIDEFVGIFVSGTFRLPKENKKFLRTVKSGKIMVNK